MRDNLFPPPWLVNAKDALISPSARQVHELCNRAVWRSLAVVARIGAVALALTWPAVAAAIALSWARRNGAAIRALTGKSATRQFAEMVSLATRYRILPKYYYAFELYLDSHRARAGDYLLRYETKQIAYRLLRPKVQTPGTPIKNKVGFARFCREHDLAAAPLIAAFHAGTRLPDIGDGRLPEGDLFLKPAMGKGGSGAERWNWRGKGHYHSTQGLELSGDALLERVAGLSRKKDYLVQPAFSNHAAFLDLSVGALCTVRLLTCENENGGHEATNASFRMAMNPKSAVDNFHAGGIAASVDLATGALGPASDLGYGPSFVWHDRHPLTGVPIAGRVLPYWDEVIALAIRAHDAFSEWMVIGWDIAILDDGPRLIEGNKGADVDIIQRTARAPMGDGRFGILLAHHLERVVR